MRMEMPSTEDVPEELPEGDRPVEMPETEQSESEPALEPQSPEIGQPVPGPDDEGNDVETEPDR